MSNSSNKIDKGFELSTVARSLSRNSHQKKETSWLNPLLYNVGVYLMTPLLLGAFAGYYLDQYFKSSPLFVIIFLLLGTVSSFYNFFQIFKNK